MERAEKIIKIIRFPLVRKQCVFCALFDYMDNSDIDTTQKNCYFVFTMIMFCTFDVRVSYLIL